MKLHERSKRLIFTVVILLLVIQVRAHADDNSLSSEELEAFKVKLYTDKTQFPLYGLVTLDGDAYDSNVLLGQYVMINLWASWCPYCKKEKASIQWLYSGQNDMQITILTVSLGEELDTVKRFMNENQYNFPVVVDRENKLRGAYAPKIPASYILDPEGNIVAKIEGNKEWDSEQALKVLKNLTRSLR